MNDAYHTVEVRRGSAEDLRQQLKLLGELLRRLAERLGTTPGVDERTVLLANLATRSSLEANRLAAWVEAPTDQIAWATRNLFELNLRVRHLLTGMANVVRFKEETVSDEIDLLEALGTLADPSQPGDLDQIHERIAAREQALHAEGLQRVHHLPTAKLAREVGVEQGYEAFFKLYSKYVHPSAFLVNAGRPGFEAFERNGRPILLLNGQQYARDTLERISQAAGVGLDTLGS
jgi:hypothetical protein